MITEEQIESMSNKELIDFIFSFYHALINKNDLLKKRIDELEAKIRILES